MTDSQAETPATVRCVFCRTLNQVDVARAAQRPTCGECGRPMLLDRPIRVEGEDFARTVLEAGVPVLVDYHADWCAPCKLVAPVVDEVAQAHAGRLLVAKVDTDRAPFVSQSQRIRGLPTVVLYEKGVEVQRCVGFQPERIRAMVEETLG